MLKVALGVINSYNYHLYTYNEKVLSGIGD